MNNIDKNAQKQRVYYIISCILVGVVAFTFAFPLYWIITGAFKTGAEINSATPVWFPSEWDLGNFQRLMTKRSAPIFDMTLNLFGTKMIIEGPVMPAALRWLLNTVFMSVTSMLLTCLTAAMAGYVLAKKRFWGKGIIFSLVVCAMALPKQVILIPLVREMSALNLYDNIWAVIIPIVGWPFGVFLLKQFAEGIPTEMVEACRIDGANEWRTFTDVMFPMIKPGVGACAIFTFINSWNDYFMQLIMLVSNKNLTISLGIATMQAESSTDYGLLMAGSALASVPIIIVFLIFQKYFTKGITMGAVKG
ncbi:MAG: carbohydrate ABC transporter permease [Eubacteriales bacterium]|nr:carbohydrate ABC transporter permease [Eubacteriales bacterium]